MARFEQQAVLTGIQSPTREAAAATEQLRESFRKAGEFGRVAWEYSRAEQAKKAAAEVQHVPGAPLGNLSPMTTYGRAFNRANEAGYMAATKNQYMDAMDRMSREHQNDPAAFENAASAYRNSMIENLPAEVRQQVQFDYDQTMRSNAVQIRDRAAKISLEQTTIELDRASRNILSEAAKASRMGDNDYLAHQTQLFYDTVINPLEQLGQSKAADDALNNYLAQVDESRYMGQFDRAVQQGQGSAFISDFMLNPPKELDPAQVEAYSQKMSTQQRRLDSLAAKRQSQMTYEQQIAFSNTMVGIESGLIGGEEAVARLDEFVKNGWIDPSKRTSVMKKMLENEQKAIDEQETYQNILAAVKEGYPVSAEKKDIDGVYEKLILPGLAGQDPETVFNASIDYVRGTKTVPSKMQRDLNALVLSDNPENIRNAARIIDAIDDIPGITEQALNTEQRAFMSQVIPLMENMSPAEAVQRAKELTDPANAKRVEARREILKKKTDYSANVASDLDPWFGPDIKDVNVDQINSEYKDLYDAYYLGGMTEKAARDEAIKTMKRNWGDFNGYVMKYPPQNYYSVAGDSTYIMKQLAKDIATETMGEPVGKENLFLVSDERTAKEAEIGNPTYRVLIVTEEGIKPLAGFRFRPDQNAEIKRIQEINKRMLKIEAGTVESIQEADAYLAENAPDWYDASGRSEVQRIEDAKRFMRRAARKETTVDVGIPVAE
jgi:hypothetical protein